MNTNSEVRFLKNEEWKILPYKNAYGDRYALSSHGRLVCFKKDIKKGQLLRLSRQGGYPIWRAIRKGEYFAILLHRLVAKYFLQKPSSENKFVIHLNHNKEDNRFKNLRWATQQQVTEHNKKNPLVIAAKDKARLHPQRKHSKLTPAQIRSIRKLLNQKKTLKEIAQKYGVSDMQIHRIKTGENWSGV